MAPRGWGFWTEAKLDILSGYLPALAAAGSKKAPGELIYLDLFAEAYERRRVGRSGQDSLFGAETVGEITSREVPRYRADPPEPPFGSNDRGDAE